MCLVFSASVIFLIKALIDNTSVHCSLYRSTNCLPCLVNIYIIATHNLSVNKRERERERERASERARERVLTLHLDTISKSKSERGFLR